jgi:hypothetical protein
MTKKQFAELLNTLKGIEASLLLLRSTNVVYVPQVPYVAPVFPTPNTTPYQPPYLFPTITCGTNQAEGFKGHVQVHS